MKSATTCGAALGVGVSVLVSMAAILLNPLPSWSKLPSASIALTSEVTPPLVVVLDDCLDEKEADPPEISGFQKVRRAVRSGDAFHIRSCEQLSPDEAARVPDLTSEIPESAGLEKRIATVVKLMELLRNTPGDEASRSLVALMNQEGQRVLWHAEFLNEFDSSVTEIVRRQFHEAVPVLESWAFPSHFDSSHVGSQYMATFALQALLQINEDRYLPSVTSLVTASPDSTVWIYLSPLDSAAEVAHPSIGRLVPHLQERYARLLPEDSRRYSILNVVGTYGAASKSDELSQWAISESRNLIKAVQAQTELSSSALQALYEALVERIETKGE